MSHARHDPADTHPPRDIHRLPKSPSPQSPSPKRYPRSAPSPARSDHERQAAEGADRQLHYPDEPRIGDVPESVKLEDQPVEGAIVMDGQMDVEMTTETIVKEEDRSDNQDGEIHGKAGPSSPVECQQPSIPSPETVAGPSKEASVTQPYLPAIPRYDAKPRFSAAYESEASLFHQDVLIDATYFFFSITD